MIINISGLGRDGHFKLFLDNDKIAIHPSFDNLPYYVFTVDNILSYRDIIKFFCQNLSSYFFDESWCYDIRDIWPAFTYQDKYVSSGLIRASCNGSVCHYTNKYTESNFYASFNTIDSSYANRNNVRDFLGSSSFEYKLYTGYSGRDYFDYLIRPYIVDNVVLDCGDCRDCCSSLNRHDDNSNIYDYVNFGGFRKFYPWSSSECLGFYNNGNSYSDFRFSIINNIQFDLNIDRSFLVILNIYDYSDNDALLGSLDDDGLGEIGCFYDNNESFQFCITPYSRQVIGSLRIYNGKLLCLEAGYLGSDDWEDHAFVVGNDPIDFTNVYFNGHLNIANRPIVLGGRCCNFQIVEVSDIMSCSDECLLALTDSINNLRVSLSDNLGYIDVTLNAHKDVFMNFLKTFNEAFNKVRINGSLPYGTGSVFKSNDLEDNDFYDLIDNKGKTCLNPFFVSKCSSGTESGDSCNNPLYLNLCNSIDVNSMPILATTTTLTPLSSVIVSSMPQDYLTLIGSIISALGNLLKPSDTLNITTQSGDSLVTINNTVPVPSVSNTVNIPDTVSISSLPCLEFCDNIVVDINSVPDDLFSPLATILQNEFRGCVGVSFGQMFSEAFNLTNCLGSVFKANDNNWSDEDTIAGIWYKQLDKDYVNSYGKSAFWLKNVYSDGYVDYLNLLSIFKFIFFKTGSRIDYNGENSVFKFVSNISITDVIKRIFFVNDNLSVPDRINSHFYKSSNEYEIYKLLDHACTINPNFIKFCGNVPISLPTPEVTVNNNVPVPSVTVNNDVPEAVVNNVLSWTDFLQGFATPFLNAFSGDGGLLDILKSALFCQYDSPSENNQNWSHSVFNKLLYPLDAESCNDKIGLPELDFTNLPDNIYINESDVTKFSYNEVFKS